MLNCYLSIRWTLLVPLISSHLPPVGEVAQPKAETKGVVGACRRGM